jgi:putative acetyltransferase
VPEGVISVDDPRDADVRRLLLRHLEFAHATTPPESVFALGIDELAAPGVTLFSYRSGPEVLAVAALKHLDADHAEVKSMHTAREARGRGIGRRMIEHVIGVARRRGYRRVSLETGSVAAFAPARSVYARAGFVACGAFADYPDHPSSTFMTLELEPADERMAH